MKLSVMDRMTTAALLPQKASFINHGLIEKAKADLSFNEEENALLDFQPVEGTSRMTWKQSRIFNKITKEFIEPTEGIDQKMIASMIMANPENFEMKDTVTDAEIELGDVVTKMIVKALEALDKAEDLTVQQLNLYKKFLKPSD